MEAAASFATRGDATLVKEFEEPTDFSLTKRTSFTLGKARGRGAYPKARTRAPKNLSYSK